VILELISVRVTLMCCKNNQELPEDGADRRRNASEL